MSMIRSSVTYSQPMTAPLDAVRRAVADPAWSRWIPFLSSDRCDSESGAVGSGRVCVMAHPDPQLDGYELRETIVENDVEAGRFGYTIANPPMPVENLGGTIEIAPAEDGTVIATWTAAFDATAENLAAVRPMMLQSYRGAFAGLDAHANGAAG